MLASVGIDDHPCKSKIYHMQRVRVPTKPHHHIVGLDIPVDKVSIVHVLKTIDGLHEDHQGRLERELVVTKIKQVF